MKKSIFILAAVVLGTVACNDVDSVVKPTIMDDSALSALLSFDVKEAYFNGTLDFYNKRYPNCGIFHNEVLADIMATQVDFDHGNQENRIIIGQYFEDSFQYDIQEVFDILDAENLSSDSFSAVMFASSHPLVSSELKSLLSSIISESKGLTFIELENLFNHHRTIGHQFGSSNDEIALDNTLNVLVASASYWGSDRFLSDGHARHFDPKKDAWKIVAADGIAGIFMMNPMSGIAASAITRVNLQ